MQKLLLILTLFFLVTAFDCGGKKNVSSSPSGVPQISNQDGRVTRRTVAGLLLSSDRAIPTDVDSVADASYLKLINDARALGYTQNLDAHLYTIIVKQDCEPTADGTPAFRIRADDYDGTEYDKNPAPGIGEVLAAEQVIMNGNTPTNTYVICYGLPELMTDTVRFGAEHVILYHSDRERYFQTVNHGTSGIAHPLIPSL